MPGGDRRGPRFMGPMTGRGLGYCTGYGVPIRARYRRFGRGRRYSGYRGDPYEYGPGPYLPPAHFFYPDYREDPEALAQESVYLKEQLENISARVEEIDGILKELREKE